MSDLRERKRRRAMVQIQSVALDLFEERGFGAVTIEEIAEQAEVSPSTVYRHFGTKEGLVLKDEWDEDVTQLLEHIFSLDDPMQEVGAFISLMGEHMTGDGELRARRRIGLVVNNPAVRRASYGALDEVCSLIADALTRGRRLTSLEARVSAHAMVFGVYAAYEHWYREEAERSAGDIIGEAIDVLGNAFRDLLAQEK